MKDALLKLDAWCRAQPSPTTWTLMQTCTGVDALLVRGFQLFVFDHAEGTTVWLCNRRTLDGIEDALRTEQQAGRFVCFVC